MAVPHIFWWLCSLAAAIRTLPSMSCKLLTPCCLARLLGLHDLTPEQVSWLGSANQGPTWDRRTPNTISELFSLSAASGVNSWFLNLLAASTERAWISHPWTLSFTLGFPKHYCGVIVWIPWKWTLVGQGPLLVYVLVLRPCITALVHC